MPKAIANIGAVVIGRNEGERLRRRTVSVVGCAEALIEGHEA